MESSWELIDPLAHMLPIPPFVASTVSFDHVWHLGGTSSIGKFHVKILIVLAGCWGELWGGLTTLRPYDQGLLTIGLP